MSTVVPLFGTPADALPDTNLSKVKPSDMISGYHAWLTSQGLAASTIKQRVKFARRLAADWGTFDRPPHEVVAWLMDFKGWTRRTYYAHLASIYAYLFETGDVTVSPLARMKHPGEPAPRPNPLTVDELHHVLAEADHRMFTWLLLGCLAGLRAHEIAKVHGSDFTERTLYVCGKGGHEALLPLHPTLWKVAQDYPRDDWWFPSPHRNRTHVSMELVSNSIRDHFRACGIPGAGATHRLRYTYGTNLARSGAHLRVVQDLLRHKQLATTERYILVEDHERQAAIAGLPGGAGVPIRPPTAVA